MDSSPDKTFLSGGLDTIKTAILENRTEYVGNFWFCKFVQEMQETFPNTLFTIQDTFLLNLFYNPVYKPPCNVEEITAIIIAHYQLPTNNYLKVIKLIWKNYIISCN